VRRSGVQSERAIEFGAASRDLCLLRVKGVTRGVEGVGLWRRKGKDNRTTQSVVTHQLNPRPGPTRHSAS
jgi:hypothetical protein